jgi:hypothetical protein
MSDDKRIDEIRADVKTLTTEQLPDVITHLAKLNGTVARNKNDISGLKAMIASLPCEVRHDEILEQKHLLKEVTKDTKEVNTQIDVWISRAVGILQPLVIAYLIYRLGL